MAAYRFCRTDDIALLVDALNRCWAPYCPGDPPTTAASFKRSIRDLQVWCSSCMVAFSGPAPVGVLIGAKRPWGTLVRQIAVHPDHRRHGHGRHLLASLGSKLSILGPPRMVAEVPERLAAACELFSASGYREEAVLTDYVQEPGDAAGRDDTGTPDGRFVIPITVDDLTANGLWGDADPPVCWERSIETLTARKDDVAGLAVASDERIEASLLHTRDGEIVSAAVDRRRRPPAAPPARRAACAGPADVVVPQGPSRRGVRRVAGQARLPSGRQPPAVRGHGAGRLMKGYHDIVGDGGSKVLEQVAEQRARITDGLAAVRHLVAVGSGKGGVGKSTLTLHLAGALRARGRRVAILDADFNGPSQARMAGVQGAVLVPGDRKVALPRTRNGIAIFSMGSLIPESEALEFDSVAHGESHTWRATREFALLTGILGSVEWGALDVLLFDLPPGAERTVQYADFLEPRTAFLLVTIPSEVSRGVVARSVAALARRRNHLLGYVENMSGYYCRDCDSIKPLFASDGAAAAERASLALPCLGTIPFDPELARRCDQGVPLADEPDTPAGKAIDQVALRLLERLEPPQEIPR